MYGIIASETYANDIRETLNELGHSVLFENAGSFSPDQFLQLCTSAASVSINILIVDVTCCGSDDVIEKGIRKYRIAKSARVILFAPNRKPGDPMISALVGDGVYDIIAPSLPDEEEEDDEEGLYFDIKPYLQKQLSMNYHMGNAARWRRLDQDDSSQFQTKSATIKAKKMEQPTPVEKIIFQDRIIGTITIGVFGATKRTGCTYSALQIASWLSKSYKTALLEVNQSSTLFYVSPDSKRTGKAYAIDELTVFPDVNEVMIHGLLLQEWEYIIIDFGSAWQDHIPAFARCHAHLLTAMSGDVTQVDATLSHLIDSGWNRALHIAVTSSDARFQEWSRMLTRSEKKQFKLNFFQLKLSDSPFEANDGYIQELLHDVLPRVKKGWWGSLLPRKKVSK